jgi:hypothetical protein
MTTTTRTKSPARAIDELAALGVKHIKESGETPPDPSVHGPFSPLSSSLFR